MRKMMLVCVAVLISTLTGEQTAAAACAVDDKTGGRCGDWEVKISKSKFNDKPLTGVRAIASQNLTQSGKRFGKPNLFLLCKEGTTALLLTYGKATAPQDGDTHGVGMRVDSQAPIEINFENTPSENSLTVRNQDAIALTDIIADGERLIIRMPLPGGAIHDAEFSLKGFREAIPFVSKPCDWQRAN